MAVFDAILSPGLDRGTRVQVGASASSTEQSLGKRRIFAIVATDKVTIRFGTTGMAAADATDFLIPANTTAVFDTGQEFTHIRVFNPTASTVDVHYILLSKF